LYNVNIFKFVENFYNGVPLEFYWTSDDIVQARKKTARRILGEGGKTFVIPTLAACDVF
jgi:hypothetical protein